MNNQGYIKANFYFLAELFDAVVKQLSHDKSRLAIWLQQEFDLSPIKAQIIGANSPLEGSNSCLAGDGLLIEINPLQVETLIQVLTANGRLTSEIIHIEIESQNSVQFAAYDHFEHIMFGYQIPIDMLESLKNRQVIDDYQLFEADT